MPVRWNVRLSGPILHHFLGTGFGDFLVQLFTFLGTIFDQNLAGARARIWGEAYGFAPKAGCEFTNQNAHRLATEIIKFWGRHFG